MRRRCDRNHVVYQITCLVTGERYVGITVVRGRAFKRSLEIRWRGHLYHALIENRHNPLQQRIREYKEQDFEKEIISVVRGKRRAHKLETEIIKTTKPELNVVSNNNEKISVP